MQWRTFFSLATEDLGACSIDSIWNKNTQKLPLQISCTMILGPHKLKNLQTQTFLAQKVGWRAGAMNGNRMYIKSQGMFQNSGKIFDIVKVGESQGILFSGL